MSDYLAFIPARGGSKGIPGKNIKLIAGRPLIHWTLLAAIGSTKIRKVVVSTDDKSIAQTVELLGNSKVTVFWRAPETATDTASTESAMLEYAKKETFGNMILLQATSPLTTTADIERAILQHEQEQADSTLSVVRQKRFLWEINEAKNATPLNYSPASRPRRQEFLGHLVENGSIYITNRRSLLKSKCRLSGKITAFEMRPETYFEIDDPEDWRAVQELLLAEKSSLSELRGVKLLLTDVDGVLTDSGMYYTEKGDELKKFNTRDGKAIELLAKRGVETGIITSENTQIVARRAKKLGVRILYQGVTDKGEVVRELMAKHKLKPKDIVYVGDDINDLSAMKEVTVSICPSDAEPKVKAVATYISNKKGGCGVLRDVCKAIMAEMND